MTLFLYLIFIIMPIVLVYNLVRVYKYKQPSMSPTDVLKWGVGVSALISVVYEVMVWLV